MDFVGSSWELYRAELEAVTFPVFVHCYLTLVNVGHGDHVGTRSGSANNINPVSYTHLTLPTKA